jgi:NADPH:quinone reductase-like Zn-dependent oxidoreductase
VPGQRVLVHAAASGGGHLAVQIAANPLKDTFSGR